MDEIDVVFIGRLGCNKIVVVFFEFLIDYLYTLGAFRR
jgi:hypothetical protein